MDCNRHDGGCREFWNAFRAPFAASVRISVGESEQVLMSRAQFSKRGNRTKSLSIYITEALHAELTAEAWECERALSDYVFGLLSRRGKWARSIGTNTGWDLQAELAPKIGTRAAREKSAKDAPP